MLKRKPSFCITTLKGFRWIHSNITAEELQYYTTFCTFTLYLYSGAKKENLIVILKGCHWILRFILDFRLVPFIPAPPRFGLMLCNTTTLGLDFILDLPLSAAGSALDFVSSTASPSTMAMSAGSNTYTHNHDKRTNTQ